MYRNRLPALEFDYLDETGVCLAPVPRMSTRFSCFLDLILGLCSQHRKRLFPPRHVETCCNVAFFSGSSCSYRG